MTEHQPRSFSIVGLFLATSLLVAILAWVGFEGGPGAHAQLPSEFLLIDEDSIDNGTPTIEAISFDPPFCGAGDPAVCVNDDIAVDAGSGLTTPLFSRGTDITPFGGLVLPTGQTGDEGLFSVGLSPSDLGAFIADFLPNAQLDPIPGAPLGEAEINALVEKTVCAKVKDSDVSSLGSGFLNAQGAYMGLTAFTVTAVGPDPDGPGGSVLPLITVDLLPSSDVNTVCETHAPPPQPDGDADGVVNGDDSCSDTPEDLDGFQDDDGCPDADNDQDGLPDQQDQDDDNDGVSDGNDNCQAEPNGDQGDNDNDSAGDACDPNDDTDPVPDVQDGDDDNDSSSDDGENFVGTNPSNGCADTTAPNDEPVDATPPDFNDDTWVNFQDVSSLKSPFLSTQGDGRYSARTDLTADGSVNYSDVSWLKPHFLSHC